VIHHASPDDFSSIEPWHSFGRPPRTGRRAAGLAGWLWGTSHQKDGPRHIRRHRVASDGTLSEGEVFAECTAGLFDGFRLDREGRIWTSARDGVHCHAPDGRLIGKVLIPEFVANVCFGGAKLDRLFICGTTSLYSVYLAVNGVPPV
jgi:gluconolactonase